MTSPTPADHAIPVQGTFTLCFVCSGNICRSPMAEVMITEAARREGLASVLIMWSAGTGGWHIGDPAYPDTIEALHRHGYDGTEHRARQFTQADLQGVDLVVVMDRGHLRTVEGYRRRAGGRTPIRLLRSFGTDRDRAGDDVPDPWGEGPGVFDAVHDMIADATPGLLSHVRSELAARTSR
jgi:protein-tyrosine phosphatase